MGIFFVFFFTPKKYFNVFLFIFKFGKNFKVKFFPFFLATLKLTIKKFCFSSIMFRFFKVKFRQLTNLFLTTFFSQDIFLHQRRVKLTEKIEF